MAQQSYSSLFTLTTGFIPMSANASLFIFHNSGHSEFIYHINYVTMSRIIIHPRRGCLQMRCQNLSYGFFYSTGYNLLISLTSGLIYSLPNVLTFLDILYIERLSEYLDYRLMTDKIVWSMTFPWTAHLFVDQIAFASVSKFHLHTFSIS